MNRSEYKLLKSILHTEKDKLFVREYGTESDETIHLVDLGYVDREVRLKDNNFSRRAYVYRVTASGREAADEYQSQRSERWWTRGLALAAVVISLFALLLELDDRGFLGGVFDGFKTSQSERPVEE